MAVAKTEDEMVTTSIYIKKTLLKRLQKATGQAGVSLILSQLGEMWLDRKIKIEFEPEEDEIIVKEQELK